MTYKTNWIPKLQTSFSSSHFLLNSITFHSLYIIYRSIKPKYRTASSVQKKYDEERAEMLAKLESLDWESYVGFPAEFEDFIVINDTTRWGALREARTLLLDKLVDTVKQKVKSGQTVIEFGSGDGRNLLFLRKIFPDINFVGIELSPISVELSKKTAEKFGISGVEFYQANACEQLPAQIARPDIGLIYTSFALEQMPIIFGKALSNMIELSPSSIVLFEPIPEVWGWSIRALASKLRVIAIDRLKNLPSVLKSILKDHPDYKINSIARSGIALNPHTEMCEVIVEKVRA